MKIKKLLLFFILLTISVLGMETVSADMGPKPTSTIEIVGMNQPYHMDLLIPMNGRFAVLSQAKIASQTANYYYDSSNYPTVLNGFEDDDKYISYTLYTDMPRTISQSDDNPNEFVAGYFAPPEIFKIVLVTNDNAIIISRLIEKTFFDAEFTFDVSDGSVSQIQAEHTYQGVGTATENIPIMNMITEFVLTVFFTLAIEIGILWLFKYREKSSYKLVIIVNVITQSLLYGIIVAVSFFSDPFFTPIIILLFGELIVFIAEIEIYGAWLRERSRGIAVIYAITANLTSFIFGFIVWIIAGNVIF